MAESLHGELKIYYLSEEERLELIRKYPIKQKRKIQKWEWNKLTFKRYKHLRTVEGLTDKEIMDLFKWLTYEKLQRLKREWRKKGWLAEEKEDAR